MAAMPAPRWNRGQYARDEIVGLFDLLREPLLRYLASLGCDGDGKRSCKRYFFRYFSTCGAAAIELICGAGFFGGAQSGLKRAADLTLVDGRLEWLCDRRRPEEQFFQSEIARRVRAVLRALPEQDRRCLMLRRRACGIAKLPDAGDVAGCGVDVSGAVAGTRGAGADR